MKTVKRRNPSVEFTKAMKKTFDKLFAGALEFD